ncbi:trypsin-3-like [Rhincodon typus]|uniref:trypsin-3-like n=1 Tax=Rhincodon typus TaxID=259920 RepID=UPI00202DDF52|nr:trypsin-3-like [Rhincodon typus]
MPLCRIFNVPKTQADSLVAHIGEHNTFVEEGTKQHIQASKVISHPSYNIMLVKLSKPVRFTQYVRPIELSSSCPCAGLQCLVSGWGNLPNDRGVQYPADLQCLDVPILSKTSCQSAYPGQISRNMFCAGFLEGGKDSCQCSSA